MSARLAALALRRAWPPLAALLALAWLALLASADWQPPAAELAARAAGEIAHLRRGLARQAVWVGWLALSAPWLAARAAGVAEAWRRGEGAWLASAPAARAKIAAATWLGLVAACALGTAAAACAAEWAADRAGPAAGAPARAAAALVHPGVALAAGAPAELELALPRELDGRPARLELRLAALGPGEGRLAIQAERGAARAEAAHEVGYSTRVAVDLPAAAGPARLSFSWSGAGEPFWIPPGGVRAFELDARGGGLAGGVLARALLAGAAWAALALGLASWMRTGLALGLLASLVLALWLADGLPAGLRLAAPGADLPGALGWLGAGYLPPELGPAPLAGTVLAAGLGVMLAAAGLARGGRGVDA